MVLKELLFSRFHFGKAVMVVKGAAFSRFHFGQA